MITLRQHPADKHGSHFSRNSSVVSHHQQDDKMKENGSNAQFDKEKCHLDPEDKFEECLQNKRFDWVVNKNQCPESFLTHSTFLGKRRRKCNLEGGSSKETAQKWNKGNERVDCSDAILTTTANAVFVAAEDKYRDNNHVYKSDNRENPVTCRKRNGHGHCGDVDVNSKSGVVAQNASKLRQSNSQSDSQDNDWFCETEPREELSYCSFCGGGENNLMMESGIHIKSRDRGTRTTSSTCAVASRNFPEPVNKIYYQVEKKRLSEKSIYRSTNANDNYTRKYKGSISNRRNDAIAISSTVAVSNLFRPLFKFILLSFLLLNCTCEVVQGEMLTPTNYNKRLDNFLTQDRNSNHDYNNIENVELTLLPSGDATSSSLSNFKNSNQHRNMSFSVRNNTTRSNYTGVDNDNHQFPAASLRKVENERKLSKTTSTASEETLRELLSQPLDGLDKDVLLKTVWEVLTTEEIRSIFGRDHAASSSPAFLKNVPNFDITTPRLSHLRNNHQIHADNYRKLNKRSTLSDTSHHHPHQNDKDSSRKLIKLEGFGRRFSINIDRNEKLLDPYFVHLHRHENRSEILGPELVEKQLGCFYHGTATHQRNNNDNDVEQGAVALSLCGGMKGFILPGRPQSESSKDGQQFHYVIQPLPNRLLKLTSPLEKSSDRIKNTSFASSSTHGVDDNDGQDEEEHHGHHIIFRRPGIPFPQLAPLKPVSLSREKIKEEELNVQKSRNNDNFADGSSDKHVIVKNGKGFDHDDGSFVADDEFPTCMHHDIIKKSTLQSGKERRDRMKYDLKNKNSKDYSRAGSGGEAINVNDELDPGLLSEQQQSKHNRMKPIILSALSDDFVYSSDINDLESLTDEERMRLVLSSPTSDNENTDDSKNSGHNFRRREKRSTNFDSETIDPFTYKPINIAPDSYWIQFRDRSGSVAGGSPLRSSSTIAAGTNPFGNGARRLSSQFSYDNGAIGSSGPSRFASSGPSTSFQPSFWQPNNPPLTQTRSIQHNLPARPARGSRYDEIPAAPEYDDTGVAGSDMTWSKGILVFESSGSDEDRHYPGKDVPFYTKNNGNKRKIAKGISTTSSVVASTSSTSSSSNTRSFDWFGPGSGVTDSGGSASTRPSWDSKNQTSTKYSVSAADGPSRKGRRDDGVFGDRWKTSLDSEIIWADRSNEISKGKFEDLTNVKDRPRSHLTIETAVFVDKDLYKHMKQNFPEDTRGEVTRIVLAMINAVQLLYQDPSLGHRVDFVLKRLEVLETDPPTLIRPYDIDRFLTNFCKWQRTENPASDADPLHWDHALILTGLDLYVVHQSGKISNQVVGLAPVAGMCTRSSSCTVNEGRHFESVFVVAHEIGHNLGMRHDGPQAENNCDPTSHIMSPTLGSGKITWSPCSKKYLDLFLETKQATCLFDKAKSERGLDHDADGRLPGERFDADRQCVLKYGRGSFHATQQPLEDVCRDLHCRREFFTWTSHPALDGTRCSGGDEMWCRAGKCVPKIAGPSSASINSYELTGLGSSSSSSGSKNDGFSGGSNHLPGSETAAYVTQKALDGGWGKWSPFTDCSSACLYSDDGTLTMGSNGVRLAARRCDSPRPENGGRQCSGPDRRYKSCPTHKICTKTPTRTTVSQYATEVCSRAAQVDTELSGRGYMSSSNDQERACSVWCETNDSSGPRSRGWSFPDGTACKLMSLPKSAQSLCVAGKCQEFSCNPYSHFRLSEDECVISSNDIIPSSNKNSNSETWYSGSAGSGGVKINHRSGKVGWTDWEVQTDCKLPCLAPAKGLQLVKRQCASDDALCSGLSLSVRLCKPDKYTVQTNGCSRLQTPFEYATKVCSKYAGKVSGLSGIGMQLSPTKDDTDRPCRIGCQDASIAYRFYMVNGEEGWFPGGTDCSRGDQDKKAYCMAGKCVDFGEDDTPLYQLNSNVMGSLFQQATRNKRQAVYNIMEPLKTEPGMDESSLKQLVHKFSQETGNYPSIVQRSRGGGASAQRRSDNVGANSIDFSKPILVPSSSTNFAYSGGNNIIKHVPYNNVFPDTNNIFLTKQKNAVGNIYSAYKNYNGDDRRSRGRSLDMEVVDVKQEWDQAQNNKINNPYSPNFAHRSAQVYEQTGNSRLGHSQPIEGSFYEWRKIVSDCSVACGTGIQEVIVQCVSGDTVVNDSLCQGRPRPGYSGYVNCQKADCARSSSANTMGGGDKGSHIWNWIQSILPPKNTSYTNGRG